MIFVGFGFLMTFLKKYGYSGKLFCKYSAVGFTFCKKFINNVKCFLVLQYNGQL